MVVNTSVYMFANVLNGAIPFLLLPVMTRHLTPTEYGVVGMFQLLMTAFAAFVGLSVPNAANRKFFDQDKGIDLPSFIGSCIQVVGASTLFCLLLVMTFKKELAALTGVPQTWVLVAVLTSGVNVISLIRLGQWQVRNQSLAFGTFQVGMGLVNIGLSLYMVVALKNGFEGRLLGQTIAIVGFAMIAAILLSRENLFRLTWRPDYVKAAMRFGVPLIPHVLGLIILSMVDRIIITNVLGLQHVGIYIVAVQLALALGIVTDAVNKAYMPWLYRKLRQGNHDTNRRVVAGSYIYFLLLLVAAFFIWFIGPIFVPWFAGEAYREAGYILGWLAFGQAFKAMYMTVTNYVYYSQRMSKLSMVTVISGVLHILLVLSMIELYGLVGAAVAFASSMAIRFLATWILANHLHAMPWCTPKFTGFQ